MTTLVWKASDYPPPSFPTWEAEHWLGNNVEFNFQGMVVQGEVVGAERHHLCNGIHDILEVEVWDGNSQVKVQAHRQKFRLVS
ncbi:MAG: hypothetical protein ACXABD_15785 [Candidatus Thorarchaeota archaeon]|jgi:hypothetical protein